MSTSSEPCGPWRRGSARSSTHYFVDLDVATIAALLGCAPGTVRATLHQARAALRTALGEPDGDDHG
ncbi:hypothetical protein GCM10028801_23060 [Nocardioides maradonensis]